MSLHSDNGAVTVPATCSFQAGAVGGECTGITVQPVTKNTTVKLSASLGSRTRSATTVLLPPFTSSDHITVAAEGGGTGAIYGQDYDLEYEVTLSNPAPADGETVTMSAAGPSLELQNTTSYIPPGFTVADFTVDVANVTAPVHTSLTATAGGVAASLPVTIEPGLAGITNVPTAITGGDGFSATVVLAGPVDTNTTVDLQSTWGILTVPLTVVIPKGHDSVNFAVTTVPVTSPSDVNIIGSLGSSTVTSAAVTLNP